MWVQIGDERDNYLWGSSGADQLEGRGGNDSIFGQGGSDILLGGDGNDYISVSGTTLPGDRIIAHGDAGNDRIAVSLFGEASGHIDVDGGEGDDSILFGGLRNSTGLFTLGQGRDSIRTQLWSFEPHHNAAVVTDYQAGADGDWIDWDEYLHTILTGWDRRSNPFLTGHLLLVQEGADTLVRIDVDGAAGVAVAITILRFQNVAAGSLIAYNLGGFDPGGGPVVAQTITGTGARDEMRGSAVADIIDGVGGNDQILAGWGDDIVRGGEGDDDLRGEGGNDRLEGGSGKDVLLGGFGDDLLFGGEGDDLLRNDEGGSDSLYGEEGNDTLSLGDANSEPDTISFVSGGIGDDHITVHLGEGRATVDGGEGDDRVDVWYLYEAQVSVTLGVGRDTLILSHYYSPPYQDGFLTVTDFTLGAEGDRLDWIGFLGESLRGWDGATNPFADGYVRLVQDGDHTLVQFDEDGTEPFGWGYDEWRPVLTLNNLQASSFMAADLGGYAPDGSAPASMTLSGTSGDDILAGGVGGDLIEGGGGADTLSGSAGHDTLRGGEGSDTLKGDLGNDVLEGGDGDDILDGGRGTNKVYGGAGNDKLTGNIGLNDELHGEAGNDLISMYLFPSGNYSSGGRILTSGGEGNDTFWITSFGGNSITLDAGPGDDIINLQSLRHSSSLIATLGQGRDEIWLSIVNVVDGSLFVVTDFEPGPAGDFFNWKAFLADRLIGWDKVTNPFHLGYLKLVQNGADTLIQLDHDSGGTRYALTTFVRLKDVDLATLGLANLDGWDPHAPVFTTGTGGADTLVGGVGRDILDGGAGNDIFRLEQGGNDDAFGGEGNDAFFFGAALTAADRIEGGAGDRDQLALQGHYAALTFDAATFAGIEQIGFLSGSDTRFGAPGTETYSYNLVMHDGNVVAGQQLTVQFNTLRVGENVTFDGSAELDGSFFTFGGQGTDILIGGQGSDRFFFGADLRFGANDRVDGQGGTDDQLGLQGDYSGINAVLLGAQSMIAVEILGVLSADNSRFGGGSADGFSYEITTHDANVAAGARLTIQANALKSNGVLNETLTFNGSAETDGSFTIFSGDGADTLIGGAGADSIVARGGNDRITGGAGADTLRGQGGNDVFVYLSSNDSIAAARDAIVQFEAGDHIDLSAIDAIAGGGSDDGFSFIGNAAFTGTAGQLRAAQNGTGGWLIETDSNGDGIADLSITLTTIDPLYVPSASDFIL